MRKQLSTLTESGISWWNEMRPNQRQPLRQFNHRSAGFTLLEVLVALVTKPTGGPDASGWKTGRYLHKLPKGPWGNLYLYLSPGIKGEIDVFSLGADGQTGGTGNDADIGSWEL